MTQCVPILRPTPASRGEHYNNENKERENSSCKAITNIFFLKTHKTASSTIMNILLRYGEFHNLTFALPLYNNSQFLYPKYFSASFVDGFSARSKDTYHIMCHHMRFLLTEVLYATMDMWGYLHNLDVTLKESSKLLKYENEFTKIF
eukprot:XP_012826101.1 PREDICTED: galactose-3-O-sulfotransferase 2-like [Xenopus tropicalis]